MRFRTLLACLGIFLSGERTAAQGQFDGAWAVQQTCPTVGNAKGYTLNFDMAVTGGQVLGQRGPKGAPDSSTLAGQIGADGTAHLRVDGLTGDASYNIGGTSAGQPYSFPVSATFHQESGTGTRTDSRPCTFAFRKVGASVGRLQSATLCGQRVDYRLTGTSNMIGVWEGEFTATNSYQREYYRCLGLVIESIASDSTVKAKYAFGDTIVHPMHGKFATKASQGSWQGRIVNNALDLGDPLRNIRLVGPRRLEGNFVEKYGHGPVWFARQ